MIEKVIKLLTKALIYYVNAAVLSSVFTTVRADPYSDLMRFQRMQNPGLAAVGQHVADIARKIDCFKNPRSMGVDVISGVGAINAGGASNGPMIEANPCAHAVYVQGSHAINTGIVNSGGASNTASIIQVGCAWKGQHKTVRLSGVSVVNAGAIEGQNSAMVNVQNCDNSTDVKLSGTRLDNRGSIRSSD